MPLEIVNWLEIPVADMARATKFYESVFQCKIIELKVGDESYMCLPTKDGRGFSAALVQNEFTKPGKQGPLVYLNDFGDMEGMIGRIRTAGGTITTGKTEIGSDFGYYALFEDTEGNLLAIQGD